MTSAPGLGHTAHGATMAVVVLAVGLVLGGCGCRAGAPVTEAERIEHRLALASAWLEGTFTSAEQAASDPSYFEVVLRHERIWDGRDDGDWFYVEQAIATAQDQPYRQRIYRVWLRPDGLVESAVYELPDADSFINAWQRPGAFDELSPLNLRKREGCEVVFTDYSFYGRIPGMRGQTADAACASTLRGASYATSEVWMTPNEIRSWDRGYDDDGEQVWGAEDGPYVFRRVGKPAR